MPVSIWPQMLSGKSVSGDLWNSVLAAQVSSESASVINTFALVYFKNSVFAAQVSSESDCGMSLSYVRSMCVSIWCFHQSVSAAQASSESDLGISRRCMFSSKKLCAVYVLCSSPKVDPSSSQVLPRQPQDGPELAHHSPKVDPSSPQVLPRQPQDGAAVSRP